MCYNCRMRVLNTKEIENAVYRLALKACNSLTPDCERAIKDALQLERENLSKFALDNILQNNQIAKTENIPVCQDTGLACVMLEIGQEVFLDGELLEDSINCGVRRAYEDGFFRKSVVDPLTRVNTKDNTPAMIHTEIVSGDKVKITFLPKGFGSENMSAVFMLTPAHGEDGIVDAVVNQVKKAGAKPCPPVYIGVGIGGSFDKCAYLAKKALTRPVGTFSDRSDVKQLELKILDKVNKLDIGVLGFKGKNTAIGVAIETYPTHIAGLPVAVNIQCHCVRLESEVL